MLASWPAERVSCRSSLVPGPGTDVRYLEVVQSIAFILHASPDAQDSGATDRMLAIWAQRGASLKTHGEEVNFAAEHNC